jgi:putative PIN family toxin of toxin-antitoxin system
VLVVIDTNILLVSISDKSKYYWLYNLIQNKKIQVAFSSEILSEYEEQIGLHWHPDVAADVTRSLTELSNAHFISVHYNLRLITVDVDDNKFADCAFAANADYIITNDNHFNILKEIEFPVIPVLSIDQFHNLLKELKFL